MNNEEINSEFKSTILGGEDFREYNRKSCLKGVPLSKLMDSLQLFKDRELNTTQLIENCKISFRLHKLQIGTEIESRLTERYPDENERSLIYPETWNRNTFSRLELTIKTSELINILQDSIKIAKRKNI